MFRPLALLTAETSSGKECHSFYRSFSHLEESDDIGNPPSGTAVRLEPLVLRAMHITHFKCSNQRALFNCLTKPRKVSFIDYTKNLRRGGSRVFSRGGGGFSKYFGKFCPTFFRSTKMIFRALPKHYKDRVLSKFSAQQAAKLWRNRPKIAVSGTFSKMFTKKPRFFGARSSLKFSVYWRQRLLLKNF